MSGNQNLITVVTPTIGDSARHLYHVLTDLRKFTKLPFRQIVSDDGTISEIHQQRQFSMCRSHGAEWTENSGPVFGVGHNLNHAFSFVDTPWAFVIEDGLRPSMGWLETAVDAVERIGNQKWFGHEVGMMGTASIQDWHLALAGVIPDFSSRTGSEYYSVFWSGEWNDGWWCWKRLLPGLREKCLAPEADEWPSPHPGNFRDLIRDLPLPSPYDEQTRQIGYLPYCAWPINRRVACGWFPGAFMLVNMDAWRKVGKFREGCTFFEGHLGIRMALNGYLSLCLHFPPWLHFEGMGFRAAGTYGKTPRHHEPCDGPDGILEKDFGCNGEGHVDLYNLVYKNFPKSKQEAINKEMENIELKFVEGWEKWL